MPRIFIFTGDLKWIVRVPKDRLGHLDAPSVPPQAAGLSARASKKAARRPRVGLYEDPGPDWRKARERRRSITTRRICWGGLEDNYRKLGVDWPANRYLLIALSADADVKGRKPMQTGVVHGWRCRYDLQTGKFRRAGTFFSDGNAKAVVAQVSGAFDRRKIRFGADTGLRTPRLCSAGQVRCWHFFRHGRSG